MNRKPGQEAGCGSARQWWEYCRVGHRDRRRHETGPRWQAWGSQDRELRTGGHHISDSGGGYSGRSPPHGSPSPAHHRRSRAGR